MRSITPIPKISSIIQRMVLSLVQLLCVTKKVLPGHQKSELVDNIEKYNLSYMVKSFENTFRKGHCVDVEFFFHFKPFNRNQ